MIQASAIYVTWILTLTMSSVAPDGRGGKRQFSPLSGEPRSLRAHSLVLFPSRARGGSPAPGLPSPTPGIEIRNLRFVIPRLGFHLGRAQDVSKLEKRRNGKEDERKGKHEDVHLVVWV